MSESPEISSSNPLCRTPSTGYTANPTMESIIYAETTPSLSPVGKNNSEETIYAIDAKVSTEK